jgi:hypothetical protein
MMETKRDLTSAYSHLKKVTIISGEFSLPNPETPNYPFKVKFGGNAKEKEGLMARVGLGGSMWRFTKEELLTLSEFLKDVANTL